MTYIALMRLGKEREMIHFAKQKERIKYSKGRIHSERDARREGKRGKGRQ